MMAGTTISFAGIIGPGQTLPLSLTGTMFYLSVSTAPLYIRTSGQVWSQYQAGMGLNVAQFSTIEVFNGTANAVTFQIFAGPSQVIDHRLLNNLQAPNIVHAVADYAGNGWVGSDHVFAAQLPDLSGKSFVDQSGVTWLAMERVYFSIQNYASTVTSTQVQLGLNSLAPSGVIIAEFFGAMATPTILSFSGDMSLILQNTGIVLASVYEVYESVQQGFQGQPPS